MMFTGIIEEIGTVAMIQISNPLDAKRVLSGKCAPARARADF